MIRLSAIDRFGELPTPVRSSGTWATPVRMASPTGRLATSSPPIGTLPRHGRSPVMTCGQLALAVAGHRGDADDLARPHVERHAAQGGQAAIVVGA